ncbi:MAG: hypothetical protein F4Y78_07570 [Candidatus Dadabacteria bacterium]|nr:hypothetical protein [Candidatus Dadabacteria bacterium]MYA36683.1 hypothetical protein [Gammaproteobacteria bacterium]MYE30534.1 hypothetical protein [Gammaproteobacteria bacterium]MYH84985.1 hypothetical protein [Gammaproteobacteria bacterium]
MKLRRKVGEKIYFPATLRDGVTCEAIPSGLVKIEHGTIAGSLVECIAAGSAEVRVYEGETEIFRVHLAIEAAN